MMSSLLPRAAALGLSLLVALPAFAGTGRDGYFDLHNNTNNNIVVGFYTNDGGGWSDNWLDEELGPGQRVTVEFTAPTGPCDQTLRVGWLAAGGGEVVDDPFDINICDASNVYLDDNQIYYD